MWIDSLNLNDIETIVCSHNEFANKSGESIGFFLRDHETVLAIRSRDNRIFDILNHALDKIDEITQTHNDQIKIEEERLEANGKDNAFTKARKNFDRLNKKRMMAILAKRDGNKCANCDTTIDLTIDHIVPISEGGSNNIDNLQILCRPCNARKGARV